MIKLDDGDAMVLDSFLAEHWEAFLAYMINHGYLQEDVEAISETLQGN